jgi:hypothetical protein
MLFQSGALFDSMTVGENVGYALDEHTDWDEDKIRARVEEVLGLVELEDVLDLMPADLSGGMKKRVALARAIALAPRGILYDEPTTGLDPITATTINALIRSLQKKLGVTSIVVTHDIHSAFTWETGSPSSTRVGSCSTARRRRRARHRCLCSGTFWKGEGMPKMSGPGGRGRGVRRSRPDRARGGGHGGRRRIEAVRPAR